MAEDSMDEKLQQLIEKQLKNGHTVQSAPNRDEELYQKVFRALNEKDLKGPSLAFSNNIIRKLKAKKAARIPFQWQLFSLVWVMLLLGVVYIASAVYNNITALAVIHFIATFKWQLLFLFLCYYIVQYADWRFVKHRQG